MKYDRAILLCIMIIAGVMAYIIILYVMSLESLPMYIYPPDFILNTSVTP